MDRYYKGLQAKDFFLQFAPTDVVQPVDSAMPSSHSGKNGVLKHDSKSRSKTFPGIAAAMADQWGGK